MVDSSVAGGFLQVWRDLAAEEAATLGSSQIWKTWELMELQSWCIHSGNRVGVTVPKLGGHRVRETCHFSVTGFLKGCLQGLGLLGGLEWEELPFQCVHAWGTMWGGGSGDLGYRSAWQEGRKFGNVGGSEVARNLVM